MIKQRDIFDLSIVLIIIIIFGGLCIYGITHPIEQKPIQQEQIKYDHKPFWDWEGGPYPSYTP